MTATDRQLLSGDEAVALAALHAGVALGTGYPGTPSTEILEAFAECGGHAQWCPNEKVALEVAIGAAYGGARALATMKHVGLNVAADPLFTVTYTGVTGALIIVSADDPGLASSQNEQDNRRYAVAAGIPMVEPSDSQEAYDLFLAAVEMSERWGTPVLYRMTTRICHAKTVVAARGPLANVPKPDYQPDVPGRVMIPAYARPAHHRLRKKLHDIAAWNEDCALNLVREGDRKLGIITSGVGYAHACEAAPDASVLKLTVSYPLPFAKIVRFAAGVERCVVVEEGDPYLAESIRAQGIRVEDKPEMYRFGELNVNRVRRILNRDTSPEPQPQPGKAPQLCEGCSHRVVFDTLRKLGCIVSGDIGCYTLGVLPPFSSIDTCVCMGASLGVGLGLRHTLPPEQARRVVSVIGDSTFMHSGIPGLLEMVYNPPPTGHVVIILDNSTTAMTGHQEHPGTGRNLLHEPARKVLFEDLARAMGVKRVFTIDPRPGNPEVARVISESLNANELTLIVARRPCILIAPQIREWEKCTAVCSATES